MEASKTTKYDMCGVENKTCSHCRFIYADPMLKNIPVTEEPCECMNKNNNHKKVLPWDSCNSWENCKDINGNYLTWWNNEDKDI